MSELLIATIFSENLALAYLLGMCTFLAVSRQFETAFGLGIAVIVIETITVPINNLIFNGFLAEGALAWVGLVDMDLGFLKLIAAIGVIAATVQILEMVLHRFFPTLYRALGIFLPLITSNCAVLGVALLNIQEHHDLLQSALYGFGAAAGFGIVLVMFSAMRTSTC